MRRVIADTGPIVALLNKRDQHHAWAAATFASLEPPLFTCEPVLAEACYLVRQMEGGREAVIDLLIRGVLQIDWRLEDNLLAIRTLMVKYASVPMSLADASLVRMTELTPRSEVLTVDSDFRVYRRSGRLVIPLIMPIA